MDRVYRVENEEGYGPYAEGVMLECEELYDNAGILLYPKGYKHPYPSGEIMKLLFSGEEYLFGFSSLTDLLNWFDFDKVNQLLEKRGFAISVYETDFVFEDPEQTIFRRDISNLISRFSLTEKEYEHAYS